ncbi:MAG: DMT family transporter [Rhodoferax sp.]|nr:DMT family transporter [Rhodoferax sp.]MBP9930703.1 DMT family transporter [Rhodoferax sp.]HQZ04368.1 DMT family transporter [Burkholderiaceae bacterium]
MPKLSIDSPPLLLLITGSLLGLTFPLGKLASAASVSPMAWAWLVSFGAGSCLLLARLLSGRRVALNGEHLRFYLLSALVSLVIPNLLIFSVIPRLGSGFTGILFTISPVFTLLLSVVWRVRTPTGIGIAGIAIGFAGALLVTSSRGELSQPASAIWLLAGLCIPASLAIGNVYRTVAWPCQAQPMELAIGSNLASATLLLALMLVRGEGAALAGLAAIPAVAAAQVLASTAMFSLFFRLQQVGGPTYLSQIGYVGAAVALLAGTGVLGERYAWPTWAGALVILIGIALSVRAQQRPAGVTVPAAAARRPARNSDAS